MSSSLARGCTNALPGQLGSLFRREIMRCNRFNTITNNSFPSQSSNHFSSPSPSPSSSIRLMSSDRSSKPWEKETPRNFFDTVGRNWEKAWEKGVTPWETKSPSPPLMHLLESGRLPDHPKLNSNNAASALVPGCGSGFDCLHLAKFGYSNVVGLDLSETAVKMAEQLKYDNPNYSQEEKNRVKFQVADFFTIHQGQYDLIFDYLFFSAIDIRNREDWARGCARLLKDNKSARIVTLIFPLNVDNLNPNNGPPYPVTLEQYEVVLSNYGFKLEDSYMSEHSIKPRKNRELVAIWSINK